MDFNLATESGVYESQQKSPQEFFRVEASYGDSSVIFEKAINFDYELAVRRKADVDADSFLENISDDPEVYPNSELYVVPEFPIGDQNFEKTTLMMYGVRPSDERNNDAIVEASLEEEMRDEKIRWVNLEKEGTDENYSSEIWYIGTDLRERLLLDHLSEEPLTESELQELVEEAEALIDTHNFGLE